jgi:hypothetical protein
MACKCNSWKRTGGGGQMTVCTADGRVFGVAVQRSRINPRSWDVVKKIGVWPPEVVEGGFFFREPAVDAAYQHIKDICAGYGTTLAGVRRQRRRR